MSLNKTLDRLFDEIRREAKRNPDFADRLDAVLRLHDSRRDVADDVVEDVAREAEAAPAGKTGKRRAQAPAPVSSATAQASATSTEAPGINPVGLFKREGEDGLTAALTKHNIGELRALLTEHNLDPSGDAASFTYDELAAHIVAQAKRRAERDEKMFDY
ncbi:MAG: hypothetical protein QM759_18005 [Terricaulis sp.]